MPFSKIFCSYCKADLVFTRKLIKNLSEIGLAVWFDENINPGSVWDSEIEAALQRAEIILVVLSKNAIESRFMKNEIAYALAENKKIIPLTIDKSKLPITLRALQYVDFFESYDLGLVNLQKTLNNETELPLKSEKIESKLLKKNKPRIYYLELKRFLVHSKRTRLWLFSILCFISILFFFTIYNKRVESKSSPENIPTAQHNATVTNSQNITSPLYQKQIICGTLSKSDDNGDFEDGLDTTKWIGAYGTWGSGYPDFSMLQSGFYAGSLFDPNSHQTIVRREKDQLTGINCVPEDGGKYALRLGNAYPSYGTEILAKTIAVNADSHKFRFTYAIVSDEPGHDAENQPSFSIKVYDCTTEQEITNVSDLSNGSNEVLIDHRNQFLRITGDKTHVYRDWTQGNIDLSKYIGDKVTIVFLNKDCGLGGHFCYSYIDNFHEIN